MNKVILGDCIQVMKNMPDNSIDSIVTDPPYELGFMGKAWDNTGIANNKEMWAEALRVLKPGGHLLAFSGTRTYHRMASAIEDAGFEVRDMIEWVYGCLSEDTEILTSNGWKMLYSVFEGDYVFACDYKNDMKLQLESVKQKFIYDYDEDAYHIKDTGYYNSELMETDHIVSKNHNVLVSESWAMDCYSNGEYPQKVFAEILYENVQKRKELGYKSEFHIPGLNGYIPCTIEKIHYKGKMWCVEVESGAFVARRNGQIFITGNSGFPKSLNIGKAVDKLQGNEKFKVKEIEFVRWLKSNLGSLLIEDIDKLLGLKNGAFHFFAESDSNRQIPNTEHYKKIKEYLHLDDDYDEFVKKHNLLLEEIRDVQGYEKSIKNWDKKYEKAILNKPKTELASEWEGWGTALKPAHEPVIVSMKPLQVEQIFAILIDNIWKHLPASDAINNLRDTQATLNEVVNSVPENVKINFLENIDNVEFVETLTTSLATKSKKEKESSAQENVVQFGEKLSQETKTHTGEVEDVSLVDISTSVQMGDISENIVLLWKNLSEELLNQTNTLTTRMATKKIIELKTLRSCLIQNTGISTGHSTKIPPNHEPICMARKPLAEKTVAENCLKYGTGGINIDVSRIEHNEPVKTTNRKERSAGWNMENTGFDSTQNTQASANTMGRFPANLIHDNSEEVRECFPESTSGAKKANQENYNHEGKEFVATLGASINEYQASSGNASRFFKSIIYQAKASKSERNKGCEGLEEKQYSHDGRDKEIENAFQRNKSVSTNNHPTVKPIALMEYLIRMVTPKGGVVLDPFAGSGSTLVAAKQNGFQYVGIEMTEEYIPIIEARLKATDNTLF